MESWLSRVGWCACVCVAMASCLVLESAQAARPSQYIALAFDGSKSLAMWQETQEFAKDMTRRGKPVKFTYFINSVYYLNTAMKRKYTANGAGRSAIGFGGTVQEVKSRYDQTNLAFKGGHEIANHAAGHFDGSQWSEAQWTKEFTQFYDMIFNIFRFNETTPTRLFPNGWLFDRSDVNGFRAPQLGNNASMDRVLPRFGILYDTSKTDRPNYWPQKVHGVWNFPLARIRIAGTNRRTLSMDYNFYYFDSNAKPDPANARRYEERMYDSYMQYFQSNYNGNRAPINIGHHFSKWNDGAYWKAMKRFAESVCGLPEVRCVTYQELMRFMNGLNSITIAEYEMGSVPQGEVLHFQGSSESYRSLEPFDGDEELLMINDPPEAHDE